MEITRLDRTDFIENYWDYQAGEHVTIIGPTGSGKTWLGYELLGATATKDLPAVVLVMKPRDATVQKFSEAYKYKTIKNWPPIRHPFSGRPAGYVLWPHTTFDPDIDDYQHWEIFRRALLDCYKKGDYIIFADETYSLAEELGLKKELITLWTKARSMGTGLWSATQRPTFVPLWAYSGAEHLFLAKDPDKKARDRFADIGGIDPELVKTTVMKLAKHEWLYIRRSGPNGEPEFAIIGP
ncbi:MAG TPA: hypothetical protein VFK47_01800 [Ktedonobacteraceae bacterium]|nr:hypothetical protein [Ktedonobacteraceae bacterium]